MNESYLKVYQDRSELVFANGTIQNFPEGKMNPDATQRYKKIKNSLSNGYLENQIILCRDSSQSLDLSAIIQQHKDILDKLVQSITSDVGRAVVGLVVLQLCVKAIEPTQSIRLHKGSNNIKDFSWCDGISMRSLDNQYITPILRKYELLRLNADGFMMTRSLAENYPYSSLYKANIKGARIEWLKLVEEIETNNINSELGLQYLLLLLLNQAGNFRNLASQTIKTLDLYLGKTVVNKDIILSLILRHLAQSDYPARLMEIAMHSLMQAVVVEHTLFPHIYLKPLSQMRSANKKHGNVGDIELLEDRQIVEAWDAKYGKSYLRDEIEELSEKLEVHPAIQKAGFITTVEPERLDELMSRCKEIEDIFGVIIELLTFDKWVESQFNQALAENSTTEQELAVSWITAYVKSLAQQRRDIAPIDEPCYQWLLKLSDILTED